MSVAPEQYRSCSACLLSNTCFFLLGHTVKGKKECVQGGWEKFEVYARHVARISIALEFRTDMLNLRANKVTENVLLDQLVVFVLSFEGN